jgi:hypothetical protein
MNAALYASVWIALALFVAAEAGRTRFRREDRAPAWAWLALLAGAVLITVHAAIALGVRYGWDHEQAIQETARQAADVYGFEWRGNIFVSYAFITLWFVAVWVRRGEIGRSRIRLTPDATPSRPADPPDLPDLRDLPAPTALPALTWAWRAFAFVMIANGAVVFATTRATQLLGMLVVAVLVWAWWPQSVGEAR